MGISIFAFSIFLENFNCKDLSTCDSVTQQMCTALPSLRANCPRKCQVEECLFTCEDTPECPENVLPAVCGLLSNDDKHKCNQTCGLCEEVTIQGKIIHLNYQWQRKNRQSNLNAEILMLHIFGF